MERAQENPLYFLKVPPSIYHVLPESFKVSEHLLTILHNHNNNRNIVIKNFAQPILVEYYQKLQSLADLLGNDEVRDSLLQKSMATVGFESKDINLNYVAIVLGVLLEFLRPLKEPFDILARESLSLSVMENCEICLKRLKLGMKYIEIAGKHDQNDLFLKNPADDDLKDFGSKIRVRVLANDAHLAKSREKMMRLFYSSLATGHWIKNNPSANIQLRKYGRFLYYLARKGESTKKAALASVEEGPHLYDFFKQLGTNFLGKVNEFTFPSITYSEDFFLPREYPEITLGVVHEALKKGLWEKKDSVLFEDYDFQLCPKKDSKFDDLKQKTNDSVEVRLLMPVKYPYAEKKKTEAIETVLIHIHGGGFVAMNARSHDVYTRTWAKLTHSAVFSINYRLAPENPYPAALDDVWQAYNWIIDNSEKVFHIKPKKIVLAGDSSGGNLALGLCFLLMKHKRRLPDGLHLTYPLLNMENDHFTPSFFGSIREIFLSKAFSNSLKSDYLGPDYKGKDPLVSPILAPDCYYEDLPPCNLVVMDCDPMHDDGILLGYRLFKLKRDVKIISYKGLCHLTLNFDSLTLGIPEAKHVVEEAAEMMNEMLKK